MSTRTAIFVDENRNQVDRLKFTTHGHMPKLIVWSNCLWAMDGLPDVGTADDGVNVEVQARYMMQSVFVPEVGGFTSEIFDGDDVANQVFRTESKGIQKATDWHLSLVNKIAGEVHGLDVAFSDSMQAGWWLACVKIANALLTRAGRGSSVAVESIIVSAKLDWERIACAAFDAYNEAGPTPWKTFDGRDVPRWPALNDAVRGKWLAAVRAVVSDERRRKEEAVEAAATAQRHADQAITALRTAQSQDHDARERLAEIERALKETLPAHVHELTSGDRKIPVVDLVKVVVGRWIAFAQKFEATFSPGENGSVVVATESLTDLIAEARVLNGRKS